MRTALRTPFHTPWRAVAAMFVLNGALFGIWASRIPAIKKAHELDVASLGLLLLCLAFGAIAAFPFAGRFSDQFGASAVTRAIALAYVPALILLPLGPSVAVLALFLFLFGATHGAMDVTMNSWAAEVEMDAGRPMMGSFHAMFSVGAGIGAASGYFAASYDVGLFLHFSGAAILFAIPTLYLADIGWVSAKQPKTEKAPLFIFPKGALLAVGIVAFCAALGEGAMVDWSAVFLQTVASVSEGEAALGYVVFSSAMVAMRLLGDRFTGALGPVNAVRLCGMAAATGSLLAIFGGTFPAILTGFALMGLGYAIVIPLAFSRAANDPKMKPGAAIASVATLGYGGLLLGPPVLGFLAELTSLRWAFLLLTALAALIICFSHSLKVQKGGDDATQNAGH